MADPKVDPLAQKTSAIRDEISGLSKNAFNATSALNLELRSLSFAVTNISNWLTRAGANPEMRNLVDVTLNQVEPLVKSISAFAPHGAELTRQADEVRPKLMAALAHLLSVGVGALQKDEGEIAAIQGQVNLILAEQRKAYDTVVADVNATLATAKQAAESAKESAKKVGVTVHMTAFTMAKMRHQKLACVWAVLTTAVAALMFGGAVFEINCGSGPPLGNGSWYVAANLSHYLARALCVSLLSFLLVFCTKNYRSARHNEIVNGHRAGALNTFDTLRTPGNSKLDEAIMLHVADAVFTPQASGYDENDTSGTHVTEQLLAALKALKS